MKLIKNSLEINVMELQLLSWSVDMLLSLIEDKKIDLENIAEELNISKTDLISIIENMSQELE